MMKQTELRIIAIFIWTILWVPNHVVFILNDVVLEKGFGLIPAVVLKIVIEWIIMFEISKKP